MFKVSKQSAIYKIIVFLGKRIIYLFEFFIELISGRIIFGNPYDLKGVKNLEYNAEEILKEYLEINNIREIPGIDEFFEEQKQLAQNRSWKSFPLFVYGNEFENNTKLCPKTKQALLKIEGFKSAMFSILSAGKEIPPHRDPYKGVLRLHLGLIIPKNSSENCYIEVDGVRKTWQFGKTLLFDDTHIHSAHNMSKEDRVVLFIDVLRPLPVPLNLLNKLLFKLYLILLLFMRQRKNIVFLKIKILLK